MLSRELALYKHSPSVWKVSASQAVLSVFPTLLDWATGWQDFPIISIFPSLAFAGSSQVSDQLKHPETLNLDLCVLTWKWSCPHRNSGEGSWLQKETILLLGNLCGSWDGRMFKGQVVWPVLNLLFFWQQRQACVLHRPPHLCTPLLNTFQRIPLSVKEGPGGEARLQIQKVPRSMWEESASSPICELWRPAQQLRKDVAGSDMDFVTPSFWLQRLWIWSSCVLTQFLASFKGLTSNKEGSPCNETGQGHSHGKS